MREDVLEEPGRQALVAVVPSLAGVRREGLRYLLAREINMSQTSASNRRRASRHVVVVPVQIDSAERKDRLGVTRDVSESGTLLLSNSKFAVGEKLAVTFYVTPDSSTGRKVQGEVVRVEPLPAGIQWRFAMALHFAEPLSEAEKAFGALEERDS
jgi:hypothetical protein